MLFQQSLITDFDVLDFCGTVKRFHILKFVFVLINKTNLL